MKKKFDLDAKIGLISIFACMIITVGYLILCEIYCW